MPLLRNHMPKCNLNIRVKELLDKREQQIHVVESVCQVERLAEVCSLEFNSIPVVNMAGRIIGLIPKSFIVILIENHWWYDEEQIRHQTDAVSNYYRTSQARKTLRASQQSGLLSVTDNDDKDKEDSLGSPRGSLSADSDEDIKVADAAKTTDVKFGKKDKNVTVKQLTSKVTAAEDMNIEYSIDNKSIDFKQPMTEREERNRTINEFTGERDYELAPKSENILHWHYFCSDFYSTDRSFSEVKEVAETYSHRYIDLRPYMIE